MCYGRGLIMKLIKKTTAVLLICVLLFGGIVGCASSDPIVGAWVSSYNSESYLYFNSDGSIGDETDKAGDGSMGWTKEGNSYYLLGLVDGEEVERFKITLDGDELSFSFGQIYGTSVYYRK